MARGVTKKIWAKCLIMIFMGIFLFTQQPSGYSLGARPGRGRRNFEDRIWKNFDDDMVCQWAPQ